MIFQQKIFRSTPSKNDHSGTHLFPSLQLIINDRSLGPKDIYLLDFRLLVGMIAEIPNEF
jgi:hypothetical protein